MSQNTSLPPNQIIKPVINNDSVKTIVESKYGIIVEKILELDGYDDKNFKIEVNKNTNKNPFLAELSDSGYVLKIVNSLNSEKSSFIVAQSELLMFINKHGIKCPLPVRQADGSYFSLEELEASDQLLRKHAIRLFVYRCGQLLSQIPVTNNLFYEIGQLAAELDNILKNFKHTAYKTVTSAWSLKFATQLRNFTFAIEGETDRIIIEEIVSQFEDKVLSRIGEFEDGIIHGDLNADNIIVDNDRIDAVIDFADSHKSCLYFELAICICYMILYSKDLESAKSVIEGYETNRSLTELEKSVLKVTVCLRLAQSIVMAVYSHKNDPGNLYLMKEQDIKWTMMKKLWFSHDNQIMALWGLSNKI